MRSLRPVVLAFALAVAVVAQNYTIQTFAGGALPENMAGTSASLGAVSAVALDGAGGVLIALSEYNIVVRLDESGKLTRVAGNGVRGFSGDNGLATEAELSGPTGIAVDAAGNVYIADYNNARVRMVSGGVIRTVAGNGVPGYAGDQGPAEAAQLNGPSDVAVDRAGNLYIADFYNQAIRQVANGAITTFAGTGSYGYSGDGGPAAQAELGGPFGIAVDAGGALYIAEVYNNAVRRVAGGTITTIAGRGIAGFTGDGGPATRATLRQPTGVSVGASGNLYIADYGNNRIRMVPASGGDITTVAGNGAATYSGDNLAAERAGLGTPQRVAVDAGNNLYLTDSGRIRKTSRGLIATMISTIAGGGTPAGEKGPALNAQLVAPQGLALDPAGSLYVSDLASGRVLKIAGGSISRVAPDADFGAPSGLAIDGAGDLYVADSRNGRIQKVSGAGASLVAGGGTTFGDNGPATRALLSNPQGLAMDAGGNLYVSDLDRVRMISKGTIATFAGTGSDGYQGDNGPATAAYLAAPNGVAVDPAGSVFIADSNNNRVRKVTKGTIATVAGNGTDGFTGYNAAPTAAAIGMPAAVAADAAGNLYIADARRILKMANGKLTTIAGMNGAQGIAVDAAGNVYVADPASHSVRMLSPAGAGCAVKIPTPDVNPSAGGTAVLDVQTQPQCAWAAESLPAWIAPATDPFGAGPASLGFTLPANGGAPRSAVVVIGGQNVTIAQAGVLTIAGQITVGGAPLVGVEIALSGAQTATTVSDSGGYFSFENLDSAANYTITPTLDGFIFTPASLTFSNVTANPVANFTAKTQ